MSPCDHCVISNVINIIKKKLKLRIEGSEDFYMEFKKNDIILGSYQ